MHRAEPGGGVPALLGVLVVVPLMVLTPSGAVADGSTDVGEEAARVTTSYSSPREQCRIDLGAFPEISGAVDLDDGLHVVNDKGSRIGVLDDACRLTAMRSGTAPGSLTAAQRAALDVEDLTVGPDGTLWLLDVGGNRRVRETVSLFGRKPKGGYTRATLELPRPGLDIEAGFVTLRGDLVLLTKARGTAEVLTAPLPGRSGGRGTLSVAGTLDVSSLAGDDTGEGGLVVTGAALSPDGRHLAVRTYAEIFEWTVANGDPVRTLLRRAPVRAGRVSQLQGEAVTYTAGGGALLALSEGRGQPLLRVDLERRAVRPAEVAASSSVVLPYTLVGGAAALLLVIGVVRGWLRWRRTRATRSARVGAVRA